MSFELYACPFYDLTEHGLVFVEVRDGRCSAGAGCLPECCCAYERAELLLGEARPLYPSTVAERAATRERARAAMRAARAEQVRIEQAEIEEKLGRIENHSSLGNITS